MPDLTPADTFLLLPAFAIAFLLLAGPFRDRTWKARIKAGGEPDIRVKLFRETMLWLWLTVLVSLAGWLLSGRTLTELGFDATHGSWRGGLAWGAAGAALAYMIWTVIEAALSRKARASIRRQIDGIGGLDLIRAQTPAEHNGFAALSVTAGITEEIVFRGVLIGALALVMPLWAAGVLSIVLFTLGHLYQGPSGMVRVFMVAVVLTAIFLVGGSLWPVIILHIAMDLTSGFAFRLVDRHAEADAAAEAGAASAA